MTDVTLIFVLPYLPTYVARSILILNISSHYVVVINENEERKTHTGKDQRGSGIIIITNRLCYFNITHRFSFVIGLGLLPKRQHHCLFCLCYKCSPMYVSLPHCTVFVLNIDSVSNV